MAKRQAVLIENGEELSDEERDEAQFEQANDDTDGDLLRSLQEMRGTDGVTFLLTRTYPNTPDSLGFVGEMTPAEFSLERVRELHGPGHYRVRVKGPTGFLKGGGTIKVAKGAAPPPSSGGGGMADFAAFMREMREQEASRRKEESERKWKMLELTIPGAITLLAAVLGRQAPQGPDIATLITAMKPAPGPSITDLVTSLSSLKALTSDKTESSSLETFLSIMEKVKDLGGEGKGDSNWTDVIRDLLKEGPAIVAPLLENLRNQQQSAQMTPIVPPMTVVPVQARPVAAATTSINSPVNTTGKSDSTNVSENSGSEGSDMMAFAMPLIRTQLEKLYAWAQIHKRPELYAEVLLDELPEIVHKYVTPEKALEYLQRADALTIVIQYEPRLAPFSEWLSAMQTELIDIITEQLKDETKTEGDSENVS